MTFVCKPAIAKQAAGPATRLHIFCSSSNSSPGSTPAAQLMGIRLAAESNGFHFYVHTEARSTRWCQVLFKIIQLFSSPPWSLIASLQDWHLIYEVSPRTLSVNNMFEGGTTKLYTWLLRALRCACKTTGQYSHCKQNNPQAMPSQRLYAGSGTSYR